jgi:acetyl-CoA carboxylase carboxyltransferase component
MGEDVDADELGGPRVHDRNGVCDLVAADDEEAALLVRDLLGYLPSVAAGQLMQIRPEPAPPGDPAAILPSSPRQVYDVRSVARLLVDGGRLLELQPKRARNVVTALARVDGRAVGIVANQPRYLGGVLDANASHKAAAFIELCDRFGLPLVVLVDTPGFLPGTRQERAGVIDAGASLVRAFAAATVPSVTVVLRKAFGGAYIAMNSRPLGAGTTMAWQGAQVGVMSATQAVAIVNRRELAAADDPPRARRRLAARYGAEHLTAAGAAAGGHVDDVIAPSATRGRVAAALKALSLTTPGDRDR